MFEIRDIYLPHVDIHARENFARDIKKIRCSYDFDFNILIYKYNFEMYKRRIRLARSVWQKFKFNARNGLASEAKLHCKIKLSQP